MEIDKNIEQNHHRHHQQQQQKVQSNQSVKRTELLLMQLDIDIPV